MSLTDKVLLSLAFLLCGAFALGCIQSSTGGNAPEHVEEPNLWSKIEASRRGPGPITNTSEVISLVDGTQVVCVSGGGLWCKEVAGSGTECPTTSIPKLQVSKPQALPENQWTPNRLDFGGGS